MLLSTGQTGALAALAWALGAAALASGRQLVFGMCLGLLLYKPPMLIGTLPVLALLGRWRALAGIAASCTAQFGSSAAVAGIEPWRQYVQSVANIPQYYFLTNTIPHHKQSLPGFFQLLMGSGRASTVLSSLAAAAVLALWWFHRDRRQPGWLLAMLIVTTILLSPHFYVYDLVVLTPALLIVAGTLSRRVESASERVLAATGYALLFAPYSGVLALHTRVQLSTIALVAFLIAAHTRSASACPSTDTAEGSAITTDA